MWSAKLARLYTHDIVYAWCTVYKHNLSRMFYQTNEHVSCTIYRAKLRRPGPALKSKHWHYKRKWHKVKKASSMCRCEFLHVYVSTELMSTTPCGWTCTNNFDSELFKQITCNSIVTLGSGNMQEDNLCNRRMSFNFGRCRHGKRGNGIQRLTMWV